MQKRLKEGYWFTFVLFEFIVIYLLTNQFIKRLNLSLSSKKYIHLFIGIILLYIASLSEKYNTQYTIINIFTIGEFSHYIYFVLGSILFPKHEKIVNSMKRNFLWGGIICTYLITDVFRYKYGFAMFRLGAMLSVTILISLGLIIIWGTFIQYKGLSEGNPIGRFLSLIGRRSLDIYFIHYFITPINMKFVGDFFAHLNIPFIEYCLAIIIAILVTFASLGIGYIIRLSPITARWLLGVNSKKSSIDNTLSVKNV
ncbi:acyltransferase family protein [Bacteroides salyersiae]|uniref:acyltransferase family protein n=1 Tax=Bacteroides salyersiae TaxID=291644 RepID=UPI0032C02D23